MTGNNLGNNSGNDLGDHIAATYTTLRIGIIVLAIALPFLLWIGGAIRFNLPLKESLSAYYHTDMRDVFVGVLFAVGTFLYLYKGFTRLENGALNLAGIFLVGVALFPKGGITFGPFTLHGTLAVLFFLSIAYVCIFRAADTLSLIEDPVQVSRYRKTYKSLGAAMIVAPLAAVLLTEIWQWGQEGKVTVFVVESAGVFTFATYWIVKSREIARTNSERLALMGKAIVPSHGAADTFSPVPVEKAAA